MTYGPGMRPCDKGGHDRSEGKDLVGGQTLTLDKCKSLCSKTPACNAIAWRSPDKRCHLKSKSSVCSDTPCPWNHRWGKDSEWSWYWVSCKGIPNFWTHVNLISNVNVIFVIIAREFLSKF